MARVVKGASVRLTLDAVGPDGETLEAVDSATLALARSSGTPVAGSPFAVTDAAARASGELYVDVPGSVLDELDELAGTWTLTRGANTETVAETVIVQGAHLFEFREFRARFADFASTEDYPPARLRLARDTVESTFADACPAAFYPTFARRTLPGGRTTWLALDDLEVTAVRTISVDGTPLTGDELDAVTVLGETGHLVRTAGWGTTAAVVDVAYEHGLDEVPPDVRLAAMTYAAGLLKESAIPSRATAVDGATGTIRLSIAGRDGITGYPDVDAVLVRWGADGSAFAA